MFQVRYNSMQSPSHAELLFACHCVTRQLLSPLILLGFATGNVLTEALVSRGDQLLPWLLAVLDPGTTEREYQQGRGPHAPNTALQLMETLLTSGSSGTQTGTPGDSRETGAGGRRQLLGGVLGALVELTVPVQDQEQYSPVKRQLVYTLTETCPVSRLRLRNVVVVIVVVPRQE
jgi:hypothetical protein